MAWTRPKLRELCIGMENPAILPGSCNRPLLLAHRQASG